MVDAHIGALPDLVALGSQVVVPFFLVVEEKPHELGVLLPGFFAVMRVSIQNQTFTELVWDVRTIAKDLNCSVIFVFVDGNQVLESMVAIFLLDSGLNDVPAQLTGRLFAFHRKIALF